MAGQLGRRLVLDPAVLVERVHLLDRHVELGHAGPARVDGELGAVLLGGQPDRRGLDPHRQVLAHDGDVVSPPRRGCEATARIRVSLSPRRNPAGSTLGSVWLSSTRSVPPSSPIGTGRVEPPLADPQVVEHAQRLPGEVPQLGMVPLGLELGDDDDREDDLVLLEPEHRARVGEQHAGVEHEGLADGAGLLGRGHVDSLSTTRALLTPHSRARCRDRASSVARCRSGPPLDTCRVIRSGLPDVGRDALRRDDRTTPPAPAPEDRRRVVRV